MGSMGCRTCRLERPIDKSPRGNNLVPANIHQSRQEIRSIPRAPQGWTLRTFRSLTFDMSGMRRRAKAAEACPLDGRAGRHYAADGTFLLVGKDLLSHVVDHHGTFEVGYGWISAVLLSDE
jgi:hypothetical protein